MGKRGICVVLAILLVGIFVGCEQPKTYTFIDFEDRWELAGSSIVTIMVDDIDQNSIILDIEWQEGLVKYFTTANGTADGNKFDGSYTYTETTYVDEEDETGSSTYHGAPGETITITISMYKDKPKATCVGEGPLSGKVFSM